MSTKHWFFGLVAAALCTSALSSARADGLVLGPRALKQKDRTALTTAVKKARAQNPTVFAKVAQAPQMAVEAEDARRGRAATIGLPLAALGKDALFPMLEMLALDAPPRGKMSDGAWTTLRVGLLEAVGMIRDVRAKPVLDAILDRESEFEVVRAAAEALGRIGDDASAKKLAKLALTPGPKQAAVVSALGECRRVVAANALAKLSGTTDQAQAQVVLKSLGAIGNAWAWQTSAVAQSGEGDQVRAIAARALMKAFVKNTGYTRLKAQTGLLVVNDPSTPSLVAAAKAKANPELASALDELSQRLANNPVK